MSVDWIVVLPAGGAGIKVRHNLVAVQVKIDPPVTGAAFTASKQFDVKPARGRQVVHRERQVKRRRGNSHFFSSLSEAELMQ